MPLSNVKPDQYEQQLAHKAQRIREQFAAFNPPELQIHASPPLHFRQRAEFKIWHQGEDSFYCMFRPEQPKTPVRVDTFPIGSRCLMQAMQDLMARVKQSEVLRRKLFQMEFLTTLSEQVLVSMIYHRPLDDAWLETASALQAELDIKIIGRSKKQKCLLSDDFVIETLTVADRPYQYQQIENSFTQPNAVVNQKMLTWALQNSKDIGGDLLELYCGNGNFTAVLSQNFQRVLATEISKTSVKSAHYNFNLNNIDNIQVVRMSSEEFSAAMDGERSFRRLKDINLDDYQFSTVLVDPPRAGLDKHTEQMVARFEHILYISCNPETLHDNLRHLCQSHTIEHFAIFDQFPYTEHIECGVLLKRKT